MLTRLFSLLLVALCLNSCAYDNAEELLESQPVPDCDLTTVTYGATIQPILAQSCFRCHNQRDKIGNINLEEFAQLKLYANNGVLVGVTSQALGFDAMPQGAPKLSDCDIARIKKWVDQGALNN